VRPGGRHARKESALDALANLAEVPTAGAASPAPAPAEFVDLSHLPLSSESMTIAQHPAVYHLLKEIEQHYHTFSAGGSASVRRHMKCVRGELRQVLRASGTHNLHPPPRGQPTRPVVVHLERAVSSGLRERCGTITSYLSQVSPLLEFKHGYPQKNSRTRLQERFAFADLVGPHGLIHSEDLSIGFVLLAPGTTYPEHAHHHVNESYITLSGTWSQNDQGVFTPGSLVFNDALRPHRITTSQAEPVLLLYAWEGKEHGGPGAVSAEWQRGFNFTCTRRRKSARRNGGS